MRLHRSGSIGIGVGLAVAAGLATAAPPGGDRGVTRNQAEMRFATVPGMPTCAMGSVQSGDPATTGFILLARMKSGCVVPWHWHSAGEHLMIIGGQVSIQMKHDARPTKLTAGGFVRMPAHHPHHFRCVRDCSLYVYSDGAFDIHYLDRAGKEITPEQALAPIRETVATRP